MNGFDSSHLCLWWAWWRSLGWSPVWWDKSVTFPIGPKLNYAYLLHSKLEIQPTFRYLGIQINSDLSTFESLNITPIISHMETRLRIWTSLPLNLIGHVSIFKMIYLPKFLYVFRASPVFFKKKLDSILTTFLWRQGAHPRIAKKNLLKLQNLMVGWPVWTFGTIFWCHNLPLFMTGSVRHPQTPPI